LTNTHTHKQTLLKTIPSSLRYRCAVCNISLLLYILPVLNIYCKLPIWLWLPVQSMFQLAPAVTTIN